MLIVILFGQKLRSIEHGVTLIVTQFGLLFSEILGQTLLIVTHIWPNSTCYKERAAKSLTPSNFLGGCLRS
jgi:hypothetical protein